MSQSPEKRSKIRIFSDVIKDIFRINPLLSWAVGILSAVAFVLGLVVTINTIIQMFQPNEPVSPSPTQQPVASSSPNVPSLSPIPSKSGDDDIVLETISRNGETEAKSLSTITPTPMPTSTVTPTHMPTSTPHPTATMVPTGIKFATITDKLEIKTDRVNLLPRINAENDYLGRYYSGVIVEVKRITNQNSAFVRIGNENEGYQEGFIKTQNLVFDTRKNPVSSAILTYQMLDEPWTLYRSTDKWKRNTSDLLAALEVCRFDGGETIEVLGVLPLRDYSAHDFPYGWWHIRCGNHTGFIPGLEDLWSR